MPFFVHGGLENWQSFIPNPSPYWNEIALMIGQSEKNTLKPFGEYSSRTNRLVLTTLFSEMYVNYIQHTFSSNFF